MDEGRKRVLGIMAAILGSLHMRTADDLFGGPQGSPRTDQLIAASIQCAERIMRRIDWFRTRSQTCHPDEAISMCRFCGQIFALADTIRIYGDCGDHNAY